jgi:predicted ester cyclase
MSANKKLYLHYQEALTTKDPVALGAAIDAVMAPDFVGHDQPPGLPAGTAGLKQFRHRTHVAFPDQRVVVEDMIEDGDRVAGRVSVTMTHLGDVQGIAATGQRFTIEFVDIVRIAECRIAERWVFLDRGAVLDRLRAASADVRESHPRDQAHS